ncbi:glycosyltransferase [Olivibacter ginsenosidimutans]|uniref:Glycosyltransferase n=1 Tax=Olivibacter ginsenosidimutans TaxID=1176537 RepID=A0ABP9CIK1_9SPHI
MEHPLNYILPGLFGLFLCIQLYYILFVYGRLNRYSPPDLIPDVDYPPLSVIICARNEEANLRLYLTEILEQDYPLYEVVVVNDCSSDDTKWVLKEFQERYKHLRTVAIAEHERFNHGKKFAVTLGVKGAQYEHLVFTDADCFPQSNLWLRYMAQQFTPGKSIVLGYSPYVETKGFLNTYIRYETYQTALNYLSFALKRNAYMGVGRNLAYTKSLFFKGKGFAAHMHIPSGDDDLFVNQNATRDNVAICIHPDAMVWSEPKRTYKAYKQQKKRHFGAAKAYRTKHKFALGFQAASTLLFYLLALTLLIVQPQYWYIALSGYLLRLLLLAIVCIPIMKKLQVGKLATGLPFLDIYHVVYITIKGLGASFGKHVSWK